MLEEQRLGEAQKCLANFPFQELGPSGPKVKLETGPIDVENALLEKVSVHELLTAVWSHERGLGKKVEVPEDPMEALREQACVHLSGFTSRSGFDFVVVTYHREKRTRVMFSHNFRKSRDLTR